MTTSIAPASFDPAPQTRASVATSVPTHVGAIMDGNGRWATRQGLPVTSGHAAGEPAILASLNAALGAGVSWLTLFAFSTENWNRSDDEVAFLMRFNGELVARHLGYFRANGVRLRYAGGRDDRVPAKLVEAMGTAESATATGGRLTLTLAFNYGGRQELVDTARDLVASGIDPELITADVFQRYTQWPDMPDVDLLIRTSGEYRISNFMLWRLAYAEMHFTDVLWPDFREADFLAALAAYDQRVRRFGSRQ